MMSRLRRGTAPRQPFCFSQKKMKLGRKRAADEAEVGRPDAQQEDPATQKVPTSGCQLPITLGTASEWNAPRPRPACLRRLGVLPQRGDCLKELSRRNRFVRRNHIIYYCARIEHQAIISGDSKESSLAARSGSTDVNECNETFLLRLYHQRPPSETIATTAKGVRRVVRGSREISAL